MPQGQDHQYEDSVCQHVDFVFIQNQDKDQETCISRKVLNTTLVYNEVMLDLSHCSPHPCAIKSLKISIWRGCYDLPVNGEKLNYQVGS